MKTIKIGDWSIDPKEVVAHRFCVRNYGDSKVASYFVIIYLKNINNPIEISLSGPESECKSDYWDFETEVNKHK